MGGNGERVAAYIDGFNLYNGLHDAYARKYLWLDLEALARSLLKPGQTLAAVRYFTARVRNEPPAERRQATYLSALAAATDVDVVEGRFQKKRRRCGTCGVRWTTYEEKETDVSIAVALFEDAVNDLFDVALLVSADSDLCPAVRALKRTFPDRRVVAVFPPRRTSGDLARAVDAAFTVGEAKVRQSLLPEVVLTPSGLELARPTEWY